MAARSTDVLIVGGGPAGLAAALALRQRGATVTLADGVTPPIDKACGEGLMPDSLRVLSELGVDLYKSEFAAQEPAPFHGIRFINYEQAGTDDPSERRIVTATAHFSSGGLARLVAGVGLRRQSLHTCLTAHAAAAGVNLRWNSTVQLRDHGRVLVAGEPVNYRWLIGADGLGSQVRRWVGLDRGVTMSRRFAFRQHFAIDREQWMPMVEVHWSRRGQAYVTPTGPGEICISGVVQDQHCRLDSLLADLPNLRQRLLGHDGTPATALDPERGAITMTRHFDRVASGRVALVGDASGSADAVTGEGMGMAFRQAQLLASSLEANDLSRYNHLHPAIMKLPQIMAQGLLLMDRFESLRNRTMRMLAANPALFARMLGVHLGAESMRSFVAAKGLELAWGLAMAAPHSRAADCVGY